MNYVNVDMQFFISKITKPQNFFNIKIKLILSNHYIPCVGAREWKVLFAY